MAGHRLNRQRFPPGMEGEELVIDSRTPSGLTWSPRGVGFDHPNADTDAATKGYADGAAGLITGAGTSALSMLANVYYVCPVGGAHTLATDTSEEFTRPANQSVFKYVGIPTVLAEISVTGTIYRTSAGGVSVAFLVFGKRNDGVPSNTGGRTDQETASLNIISGIAQNVYYNFANSWITQLATDDHIAPMFLSFLSAQTFNLALTQTRIRTIREV